MARSFKKLSCGWKLQPEDIRKGNDGKFYWDFGYRHVKQYPIQTSIQAETREKFCEVYNRVKGEQWQQSAPRWARKITNRQERHAVKRLLHMGEEVLPKFRIPYWD